MLDESRPRVRSYRRFLLLLLAVPAALMLATIPLARTPSFLWWTNDSLCLSLDYRYSLKHVDADVVIFGDSTSILDFDPKIMESDLHMSVVDVGDINAGLAVHGAYALESYLKNNKPPRLLVICMSPWNTTIRADNEPTYEAIMMLVRHHSWGQIFSFATTHPIVTARFQLLVLKRLISPGTWMQPKRFDLKTILQEHKGHFPSPSTEKLPADCVLSSDKLQQPEGVFTKALVEKYETASTQAFVYLSPIPACSGAEAFQHYSYEGIAVNKPELISPGLVVSDSAYAHFVSGEVEQATHDLDSVIQDQIKR